MVISIHCDDPGFGRQNEVSVCLVMYSILGGSPANIVKRRNADCSDHLFQFQAFACQGDDVPVVTVGTGTNSSRKYQASPISRTGAAEDHHNYSGSGHQPWFLSR